jgi:hypothetical protein
VRRLTLRASVEEYDDAGDETDGAPTMRETLESMAPPDAPPAFRWWTFGILIAYTASLLVFCGVVTARHYSPADALSGRLAASIPPHLPIASFNVAPSSMGSFNVAHVELGGTSPRWVCYQVAE